MVAWFSGVVVLSLLCLQPAWAQESVDLAVILKFNPIEKPQHRESSGLNLRETSELKLFSASLIRVYQRFISTQDRPVCNFTPSCSRFGMAAIQRYGFLRGILLTADRLTRDHGMIRAEHYHTHPHTGHYADAVEDYSPISLTN